MNTTKVTYSTTSPGPNPYPAELLQDDPDHPGFVLNGVDDTPGQKAYYIHLEAKPGKGELVQNFLRDILAGVEQEPLTGPWFAVRFSESTFGVFEAFPDAEARHSHDKGPGGQNFLRSDELHDMLTYPSRIYRLDVLFGKFNVMFGKEMIVK
jgi:quinol monooxygenase YgiN